MLKDMKIHIEWQEGLEPDPTIEGTAKELLEKGVAYLNEAYEKSYPLPATYTVIIGRRRTHGNLGAEMHLSKERLARHTQTDPRQSDEEQSLIIHELVHNLRDEEDLPMITELMFMLERGHVDRLEQILQMKNDEKLPQRYLDGLQAVATAMDYQSIDDIDTVTCVERIDKMKATFRTEIQKIETEIAESLREGTATLRSDIRLLK